jgi:hypothetical protein
LSLCLSSMYWKLVGSVEGKINGLLTLTPDGGERSGSCLASLLLSKEPMLSIQ